MTLAASALTHLAQAAAALLIAGAIWDALRHPRTRPPCACGHDHAAHTHYRRGTDCAQCACTAYEPPAAGDAPAPGRTPNPRQPGHQPPASGAPLTAMPPPPAPRPRPDGVRIPGDDIAAIHVQRTCGCMEVIDPQRRTRRRKRCTDHDAFAAWARQIKETQ